jgi:hypothetical protein
MEQCYERRLYLELMLNKINVMRGLSLFIFFRKFFKALIDTPNKCRLLKNDFKNMKLHFKRSLIKKKLKTF